MYIQLYYYQVLGVDEMFKLEVKKDLQKRRLKKFWRSRTLTTDVLLRDVKEMSVSSST